MPENLYAYRNGHSRVPENLYAYRNGHGPQTLYVYRKGPGLRPCTHTGRAERVT